MIVKSSDNALGLSSMSFNGRLEAGAMCFRKALFLMLVFLPGCSAPEDTRHRVIGNGAYVSIFDIGNETEATALAVRHCQQYGKTARLREMTGDRAVFECVSG